MKQSITRHAIGSDDDPQQFWVDGDHYATIQAVHPFDSDTICAFIMADIGHDLQHVNMSDHEFYTHPVFRRCTMCFIDTEDENVYLVV